MSDQAQRRRDTIARAKQSLIDGTFTGSHGNYCLRLGCKCEEARKARERQRSSSRRAAQAPASKVEVRHWPPRGEGLWACPECGETFLHRPLVDQLVH